MAESTNIEWADASWNPWMGCDPVSPGCKYCYAKQFWKRLGLKPGEVRRAKDATFNAPLHWKEPKRIIVGSITDFFHEAADKWRKEALEIMARCQRHTFIIPTKRPERIIECLYGSNYWMPNWWFLASVENQEMADKRIPELLKLRKYGDWPVLGLSVEPMLGLMNLRLGGCGWCDDCKDYPGGCEDPMFKTSSGKTPIDWVVCGGESGPNARPCHPDWVRSLRDQCIEAGVPFYFKQWGEYILKSQKPEGAKTKSFGVLSPDGTWFEGHTGWNGRDIDPDTGEAYLVEVGKKAAGRLLDGRVWDQNKT